MAKEIGAYLDELLADRGEPQTWGDAVCLVAEACAQLGADRQRLYGHGNIAKFGLHGIVIRATDKVERAATMVFGGREDSAESVEDTCGDLANYGVYGVMLNQGWWGLPFVEDAAGGEKPAGAKGAS